MSRARTAAAITIPDWQLGKPRDEHDAALLLAVGFWPLPGWPAAANVADSHALDADRYRWGAA